MAEGIECFRVQFPKGMDANEYALQGDAGGEEPGRRCSGTRAWLGKGKASRCDCAVEPVTGDRRARAAGATSKRRALLGRTPPAG